MKYAVVLASLFLAQSLVAQPNTAPTVFAGNDTTVRLVSGLDLYRFTPTITDDGKIYYEPLVMWTQIAGPQGGVEIAAPDAQRSLVKLYMTGQYTFVITVDDSQYIDRDTINVTVQDSIPFQVLRPAAGESILAGSQYTVRWRIDPPGTDVIADYSIDGGLNFSTLILNRTTDSSYQWDVPSTVSEACQISIRDYFHPARAVVSGIFKIGSTSVRHMPLAARVARSNLAPEVYSIEGRRIAGSAAEVSSHGVVIRRVQGPSGRALRTIVTQ